MNHATCFIHPNFSQGIVRIGSIMSLTESRNVEFKKGGALHSQRALKEVLDLHWLSSCYFCIAANL